MKESERTPRWMERLEIYGRALEKLTDVIDLSRQHQLNDYERDSLIKRFEFTFEMAWKLMMSYEKENGIGQILGSRDVVRHATALSLIDNGEAWMDMIDARNQTSHLYDENTVNDIVDDIIHTYHPLFEELQKQMKDITVKGE